MLLAVAATIFIGKSSNKSINLFASKFLFVLVFNISTPTNPNLCDPRGTMQCENYQTCCSFSDGRYGCCPFTAANCCPDLNSCCPAGFRCGNESCIRCGNESCIRM
ncbi:unnamed protein product [Haemonchus placei]|uniref:GRANULINS domain-containing protein n=1 Tax=Haemonchus placei TaxID=6290 RepID=A0A0N4WUI5_HAEPC|nr:unnamed protein product [Haemonchus placei]